MKKLFPLLFFIAAVSYGQQNEPQAPTVTDTEIYSVLNAYFSTEDRFFDVKSITSDEAYVPKVEADTVYLFEMDTLFTKEDIAYLCLQAKDTMPFKIERDKATMFPEIDLVVQKDVKSVRAALKDEFESVYVTFLSKPLFTKDHKTAILYVSVNDLDRTSIPGESRHIYIKKGEAWELVSVVIYDMIPH